MGRNRRVDVGGMVYHVWNRGPKKAPDPFSLSYTNPLNSSLNHSARYVYDYLDRLACAQATGNSTYNLDFSYDRFGNVSCVTNQYSNGPCPGWTYNNTQNHVDVFTYDAAGNVLSDGSNTYQWDAEGRPASLGGATFGYDALGRRAYWYGGWANVNYLHDPAGQLLGHNIANTWYGETVMQTGLYRMDYGSGGMEFQHFDRLGSGLAQTYQDGSLQSPTLYYPWGQPWTNPNYSVDLFAGFLDWDGSQYAGPYRVYPDGEMRWPSPDPLGGDITNPQSLNRYAYVLNNPAT